MKSKLKVLREKRGLSQAEVAQEIGISRQMYNKYERGDTKPSLSSIKALCTLYAVSYEELIDSVDSIDSTKIDETEAKEPEKDTSLYKIENSYGLMAVASSHVAYGTENYYSQIIQLLPHLLLSEKSRLLTAVAESMTEEVEIKTKESRERKSQPMKVNQIDVYFPTEEEHKENLAEFLQYANSNHFTSNGKKWTREEMHER